MANIRNLLRQSILDVKKLKQASAETTKDMLLAKITEDVKRKLRQEDLDGFPIPEDQQEVVDEFIEQDIDPMIDYQTEDYESLEDVMGESDVDFANDEIIPEYDNIDEDQESVEDLQQNEIDNLIQELQNELAADEVVEEQEQQNVIYQNELDNIIEQLQNELDSEQQIPQQDEINDLIESLQDQIAAEEPAQQMAYTEEIIGNEFPEAVVDQDQEILERIREILQSEDSLIEEQNEEQVLYDQQDVVSECGDAIEREQLKIQNRKLKQENRQMMKAHNTIQRQIKQTKNIHLRGQYAKKLFERYNLSKVQKIKILQNFDRANSEREIKLVYATLMQGLRDATTSPVKKHTRKPASGRINSTRSRIKQNLEYKEDINDSVAPVRQLFKRRVGL